MSANPPTTEGDLRKTPFAHLLVYALERQLTGEMILAEPEGMTHAIRFERGVVAKVRLGEDYARLGELLLQEGAISQSDLASALQAGGLLGERLIQFRRLAPATLSRMLERQIRYRTTRLFALPSETTYVYFDGDGELAAWGGSERPKIDPLSLLWEGLRTHGECSTKFMGMVTQIAGAPLRMHPRAPFDRLGLDGDELLTAQCIAEQPTEYIQIVDSGLLEEPALRRLVYALAITRQLDLGLENTPVGMGGPSAPYTRSRSNSVARLRLTTASFRLGVAAPDLPGDGERAAVSPSARRRKRSASGSTELDDPIERDLIAPSPDSAPATSSVLPLGTGHTLPAAQATGFLSPSPAVGPSPSGRPPPSRTHETTLAPTLYALAESRLKAEDLEGAHEACERACRADPDNVDYSALLVWIRSCAEGADVKGLTLVLDRLLSYNERHLKARYYRALLRHRLGDNPGALRDLRRTLEVDPGFSPAARDLAALEARLPKPQNSFFGRLFKR